MSRRAPLRDVVARDWRSEVGLLLTLLDLRRALTRAHLLAREIAEEADLVELGDAGEFAGWAAAQAAEVSLAVPLGGWSRFVTMPLFCTLGLRPIGGR